LLVHIGDPSSNQVTTLESHVIHMIQELFGQTLRAVQLLLGHTKIESTVRYLGIEVDDALAIVEQADV